MEELQSTELLDREILEDARKKVLRILKAADDSIHNQGAEWEKKTEVMLSELEIKYREQCGNISDEIMARLPVDKRRIRAQRIEGLISQAADAWYAAQSKKRILDLLCHELSAQLSFCKAASFNTAYYSNLSSDEIGSILKSVNINCASKEKPSPHIYPFIILENDDIRITSSIKKTIDFLLQEKRAELIEALLGEQA
jgi:hypothetical protein